MANINKLNITVRSGEIANPEHFNRTTRAVDQIIDALKEDEATAAAKYVTLEELKTTKANVADLATVNNQTLINKGGNIDTTPLRMSDDDINEIFNSLQ